ncbi:hypothetical protein B0H17DRAFT_1132990 [Mycena rosella]|uniref:Uncharacterized protein n=1 Tax=Mycena rosella TaxID=1033263 RepID=A0AAD7DJJ9_MYCRO|nr:hypothetical protein B0H17DRAFT_1132990 [Mycena rosella]
MVFPDETRQQKALHAPHPSKFQGSSKPKHIPPWYSSMRSEVRIWRRMLRGGRGPAEWNESGREEVEGRTGRVGIALDEQGSDGGLLPHTPLFIPSRPSVGLEVELVLFSGYRTGRRQYEDIWELREPARSMHGGNGASQADLDSAVPPSDRA